VQVAVAGLAPAGRQRALQMGGIDPGPGQRRDALARARPAEDPLDALDLQAGAGQVLQRRLAGQQGQGRGVGGGAVR
jgi:hypothetical protein